MSEARVRRLAEDTDAVAKARKRLVDLGWLMKCLKEPLARLAKIKNKPPPQNLWV